MSIRQTARRLADEHNAVVTIEGGNGEHCHTPCAECPWRRENAGSFPAEAFRISAPTAYDMAAKTFACHMAGTERPRTCAGALLSTGADHNMQLRMRSMMGKYDCRTVSDGGADLFEDYRSMAEANGVHYADPVLGPCR